MARKNYGPAMEALKPLQRRYVIALFENPGMPKRHVLKQCGYKGTDMATDKMIQRLHAHPAVQAAITEYGLIALRTEVPEAVSRMHREVNDPKSRNGLKAALAILDRAGLNAPNETHVTITHTFDRDAALAQIAALLEKHKDVLVLPAPVTEVELEPTSAERPEDE